MTRDQLEFSISQYLDGTLNELDRSSVDEILARDAEARTILAEYQQLNGLVKSALPMPEMNWDRLAAGISAATAREEIPVRHYRLSIGMMSKAVAVAASLLIVIGVVMKLRPRGKPAESVSVSVAQVNPSPVQIELSAPPVATAQATTDISIGQPAGYAAISTPASEAVISTPASFWIASGAGSAQDTDQTFY